MISSSMGRLPVRLVRRVNNGGAGVHYRPYRSEDAGAVKRMMDEAFHVHRYARSSQLLNSALEMYLRDRLLVSTWTRVAEQNGRVIGVIMGQVTGEPPLSGAFVNRIRKRAHQARIALASRAERKMLMQFFAFDDVCVQLAQSCPISLANELTLLAVDSSARGSGVGRALYQQFLEHLCEQGRTEFHLYTDSTCTFQFYENQGMTRVTEQPMNIEFGDNSETLDIYLYTGKI